MAEEPEQTTEALRAAHDQRFAELPAPGTPAYWPRIESTEPAAALPLEVLARCLRERMAAGATRDATRIFELIMRCVQPTMRQWAQHVGNQAHVGRGEMSKDLQQEAFLRLWQELIEDGPTYLLVQFNHAFHRLRQRVAQDLMERAGERQRPGVERPTRVPQTQAQSLDADPPGDDTLPYSDHLSDPTAQDEYARADMSDLLAMVLSLPAEQRRLILERYWLDHSPADIAAGFKLTDRAMRFRLAAILRDLRVRYTGGEEVSHA